VRNVKKGQARTRKKREEGRRERMKKRKKGTGEKARKGEKERMIIGVKRGQTKMIITRMIIIFR
jgi:hypothetical protein